MDTSTLAWGELYRDEQGRRVKWFKPTPNQAAILNSKAMYMCALGGNNSGKSSIAALALAQDCVKRRHERPNEKFEYLVMAPNFGTVLGATRNQWDKVVKDWIPGAFHPHQTNPHWLSADGKIVVYFRSCDGHFMGLKPKFVWLDEGGDVSETLWNDIKTRVGSDKECRVLIATTPYPNHEWIRTEIIEQSDNGNPAYFYRCLLSKENPTTNLEHLEQEKRNLADWEYKLRYEGVFSRPPSLVFDFTGCYVEQPEWVDKKGEIHHDLPPGVYGCGVDFGGNDATAILWGLLDDQNVLWLWREYYKSGKQQDIEIFLQDVRKDYAIFRNTLATGGVDKDCTFWCDHRPEIINAFRRSDIDARRANKKRVERRSSIEVGISLVNARINSGRLKIIKGECPSLRAESLKYRYPCEDGVPVGNIPIDKDNHACDALRYLVMGFDRHEYGRATRRLVKGTT